MQASERSVLHVLPHPGGGGQAYCDLLAPLPGYRASRVVLAPSPSPAWGPLTRGVAAAWRRAATADLLHVHGEIAAGLCLPVLAARPAVVTLHGLHLVRRLDGRRRAAAAASLRAVLRAADRTICVSQGELEELVRSVGPRAAQRAVVIPNGVRRPPPADAKERPAVRAELGVSGAELLAIWVGSLDERKDPLTAVRAAELADVALVVIGDGPLRQTVERAATGSTRILGHREDVPRLLAAADVYVLTSRREGMALALLEAMAAGCAAVVTHLPENREAAGETALTTPVGDEQALAAALRQLADNPVDRETLGALARERVGLHFTADAMLAHTGAVYDAVLARRRR